MTFSSTNNKNLSKYTSDDVKFCEWLFCPSDVILYENKFNKHYGMIRICPKSNSKCLIYQRRLIKRKSKISNCMQTIPNGITHASNAELVQIEPNTNIYYFHFGDRIAGNINCYIKTMAYKWPKNYTFMIWVKWEPNCGIITTFDSRLHALIVGNTTGDLMMGCASIDWVYAEHTKMLLNEWQFVVAVGGCVGDNVENKKQTLFYCGSLNEEPIFSESIECDVSGEITSRIGNESQGPGKVAYIKVLKCHLNNEQIIDEYYISMNEIYGVFWSKDEYRDVLLLLIGYCAEIEVILKVIVHYCCRKAVIEKYSQK